MDPSSFGPGSLALMRALAADLSVDCKTWLRLMPRSVSDIAVALH